MQMRARRLLYAGAAVIFSLSSSLAYTQGNGHGNGHGKHHRDDDDDDRDRDRHGYSDHDRDEFRSWYRHHYDQDDLPPGLAKRDRLPPGLERQLVRRGTLPPGLRKKYYRCPDELERRLPPPPPECQHVLISGHIVLLNRRTNIVVDIFHFEGR